MLLAPSLSSKRSDSILLIRGIAVDGAGNVYVAGEFSDNAFKITTPGSCSTNGTLCTITEIIDSSGAGPGKTFDLPKAIAVDDLGNAYVTGVNSDNAFKITPAGVINEIINAGDGLDRPFGVAVDVGGNVYVAGTSSDNAYKITPAGVISEIIDMTGAGSGDTLDFPIVIAVDTAGNVYVTGHDSNNAFKITASGSPNCNGS